MFDLCFSLQLQSTICSSYIFATVFHFQCHQWSTCFSYYYPLLIHLLFTSLYLPNFRMVLILFLQLCSHAVATIRHQCLQLLSSVLDITSTFITKPIFILTIITGKSYLRVFAIALPLLLTAFSLFLQPLLSTGLESTSAMLLSCVSRAAKKPSENFWWPHFRRSGSILREFLLHFFY